MRIWLMGDEGGVAAISSSDGTCDVVRLHEDELDAVLAGSDEQLIVQVCL